MFKGQNRDSTQRHQPREKGKALANSRLGTSALCRSFGAQVNKK